MKNEKATILNTPLTFEDVRGLEAGDLVEITGTVYTARDKAYKRILEKKREGKDPPVDLNGGVVYHCGPLAKETKDGWKIVAAGPTTSARMDDMEDEFVKSTGVRALIGKGGLGPSAAEEISELGCVYLAFTGGAAALAADSIVFVKDLFWEDLGTAEALWALEVKGFGPLLVGVDVEGRNLYERK